MYIHSYSKAASESEIFDFVRTHGFATLISTVEGKLWASHVPLVLSPDARTLTGHLSRGNRAWRSFETNPEVLCVFQGPHTYISSSWYDHENVPTWNYMIAQVRGAASILSESDLLESLKELTNKYEKQSDNPVTVEGLDKTYLQREMKGIVGFKIDISAVEASFKLSQNRDDKNYANIVAKLEQRGDAQSAEVADVMKKIRGPLPDRN